MPAASVASISICPLRAGNVTPLTLISSWSSLLIALFRQYFHHSGRGRLLRNNAATMLNIVFEFVAVVVNETLYRPCRRIAKRADRMSLDLVRDIHEHIHIGRLATTRQNPSYHAIHPAGALAARSALTARLRVIESRDALEHPHHIGRLVHHDYCRGPER